MRNLQEYGLWLVLVTINAVIVSQWVNYLINMSSEAAGLAAGLFLSIFLEVLLLDTLYNSEHLSLYNRFPFLSL